jgi:hypothetical protein
VRREYACGVGVELKLIRGGEKIARTVEIDTGDDITDPRAAGLWASAVPAAEKSTAQMGSARVMIVTPAS